MLMRFQLRLVGAIISSDGGHSMCHAACGMVRNAFVTRGERTSRHPGVLLTSEFTEIFRQLTVNVNHMQKSCAPKSS